MAVDVVHLVIYIYIIYFLQMRKTYALTVLGIQQQTMNERDDKICANKLIIM